jgi:hypothetical protein
MTKGELEQEERQWRAFLAKQEVHRRRMVNMDRQIMFTYACALVIGVCAVVQLVVLVR